MSAEDKLAAEKEAEENEAVQLQHEKVMDDMKRMLEISMINHRSKKKGNEVRNTRKEGIQVSRPLPPLPPLPPLHLMKTPNPAPRPLLRGQGREIKDIEKRNPKVNTEVEQ